MKQVTAVLVKAFSKSKEAGNPAGVITDASGLSATQMQAVAKDLGFSESAFVTPSDKADFRVRFFSPTQEVDFCGHATIATFHALIEQGRAASKDAAKKKITQETNIGVLPVLCEALGKVTMVQTTPVFGAVEQDRAKIAGLLGIHPSALLALPIQVVSTGTPKLMIPVNSLKTLHAITPNLAEITAYCKDGEARGFYPFTSETMDPNAHFHARQFNPLAGIDEDPITGIAAGALGCYATKYELSNSQHMIIEQGYTMSMGGQMFVDLSQGVQVGGFATTFGERIIET
jgi:trans-2,3-dihydro-3-hydroxyanthranilate isomerase